MKAAALPQTLPPPLIQHDDMITKKQFYEKVSDDPGGKSDLFVYTLSARFQEATPYINNIDSKPETAH